MNKLYLFLDTLSSFSAAKTCWPTCTRLFDVRLYFSRKHQTNTKKSVKDKLHRTYTLLLQQPTTSTYNTEFCLCSISSCVSHKHSCLQSLHTLLARAQIWQKTTKHHSSTLSHTQGKKRDVMTWTPPPTEKTTTHLSIVCSYLHEFTWLTGHWKAILHLPLVTILLLVQVKRTKMCLGRIHPQKLTPTHTGGAR